MKADKVKVLRLLKTASGQIDGIVRMIEADRYCIDISNQLLATASVLNRANKEVLHAHLSCCVMEAMEAGNPQEKLKEISDVLDKLLK